MHGSREFSNIGPPSPSSGPASLGLPASAGGGGDQLSVKGIADARSLLRKHAAPRLPRGQEVHPAGKKLSHWALAAHVSESVLAGQQREEGKR